jgi:Leucine-rich repeat (LRR) protein
MPNPNHRETNQLQLHAPILALLASACSGNVVDLGEVSRNLTASESMCQASGVVESSVLVEDQEQLNQLLGCEQIKGDLQIRPFEGPDFRPLASLRTVDGTLELGRPSGFDVSEDADLELARQKDELDSALLEAGWLDSFEGFEGLTRVGSLLLRGVSAPSLEAFSNLDALTSGVLAIGPCTNLRDLTGLEGVSGLIDLTVSCDSLESLAGLSFPARMRDVDLAGSRLAELGAFDVQALNLLRIENTALENLDALGELTTAVSVSIAFNPALTDTDALNRLSTVSDLLFRRNPLLERLAEFTSLLSLRSLSVSGNDTLTSIGSFPNLFVFPGAIEDWDNLAAQNAVQNRADLIEVSSNPALERLSLPIGWLAAGYVDIFSNATLESIDFAALHSVDRLVVFDNPELQSVDLGNLTTVDNLRVAANAILPLTDFDGLRTFESVLTTGPLELEP